MPSPQVAQVRQGIASYHRVKAHLEKISEINRELLRRTKGSPPSRKKAAQ